MDKVNLSQGDKINFELDGEDYITEAYSDDLGLTSNSLIVINNTLCCTGNIIKIADYYKVQCFYKDALIVQDEYYYGKQSELD